MELPYRLTQDDLKYDPAALSPLNASARFKQTQDALKFLLEEASPEEAERIVTAARALWQATGNKVQELNGVEFYPAVGMALETAIIWERG